MILYDKNIGKKNNICMDEYYVSHFYQMKPIIKYYLVKIMIYNIYTLFFTLCILYLISM